jgi:hypothetical protein
MGSERHGGVAEGPMDGGVGGRQSVWHTPTPYLFLGIVFLMGLIAVALLVLICIDRKSSSSSSRRCGDEEAASVRVPVPLDNEPKVVVVIMAGDTAPSFLAATTGGAV